MVAIAHIIAALYSKSITLTVKAKDKQFKEARQKRKAKKDNIRTFIKENPTTSTKGIAIKFDVSTRTIQRIRKELRK